MDAIAGVDGCPGGWIAIQEDLVDGALTARVFPDAHSLLSEDFACIGIDIPIGLPDKGSRAADLEARRVLSPLRHNSVFPAPVRAAVGAPSRQLASQITKAIDGRGAGAQAFAIYPRIREVDEELRRSPTTAQRVFEVHPEVSFWALNGNHPCRFPKRTPEGKAERLDLLLPHFGSNAYPALRVQVRPSIAADDDILDALAALWTCRRIYRSQGKSLPSSNELGTQGIRMAIWY